MNDGCLIIDVGCIVHRNYHAMRGLSFNDEPTGVLFGFFRDMRRLQERFGCGYTAFCFDSRESLRRTAYPAYKTSRIAKMTDEEREARKALHQQITRLKELLPAMGYANLYEQRGYEADDLIAAIVLSRSTECENIIVSSDHDLLQLLNIYTILFNPYGDKTTTAMSFLNEWHIDPGDWWKVLAIAGCTTDDIQGIRGVGLKTAAAYVRDDLKHTTKAWAAIRAGWDTIKANAKLVRLPLDGCCVKHPQRDDVTAKKLNAVVRDLGINTLVGMVP